MRLQSKKSNKTSIPPYISGIFLLSLIYWLYLSITTKMIIACDSIDYQYLGRLIHNHGWAFYFTPSPNREPVYPLLVSLSMHLEAFSGISYVKTMAVLGVVILFLVQAMTYLLLRLLNVRDNISAWVLAYLALSPALLNTAFSLYSEIAAIPFILGIILCSYYAWDSINNNQQRRAIGYSALLGVLLALSTLTKAVFECIAPAYLIIFFIMVFLTNKKITNIILCIIAALGSFYLPVSAYKSLNYHYNGNFAITNRASWALYGNTYRRMEPLTVKRLATSLAYAPGEGVCKSIFKSGECDFWSFKTSDKLGMGKQAELYRQHLPDDTINATLIKLSAQKALSNPFQYGLLTIIEGSKMFFWESTQIGFVTYPSWLEKIYHIKLLNNALRFLTFLLTIIAVISLWRNILLRQASSASIFIGLLIFLYITFFSFFFILTRYALPIAPLYLIAIALWFNQNFSPKEKN